MLTATVERTVEINEEETIYVLSEEDRRDLTLRAEKGRFRVRSPDEVSQEQLQRLFILDSDPLLCSEKYRAHLNSTFLDGLVLSGSLKICYGCEGHNKGRKKEHCYFQRAKYTGRR